MKIISFEVVGLFGKERPIRLDFNSDINIITGRNGSGKTSLLKLLWYIVSGNIEIALREVNFRRATVITSEYDCTVHRINSNLCKITLTREGQTIEYEDHEDDDGDYISAEGEVNNILLNLGSSVFLPTFRRIEGGFTIGTADSFGSRVNRAKVDIEDALTALSKRLSNKEHIFVASISTSDIVKLVLQIYTDLTDIYTEFQQNTSQEIIDEIKNFESDKEGIATDSAEKNAANAVLKSIRNKVEQMEVAREEIMTPIEEVRKLVESLFKHAGIKISNRLSFGDAANAINSDALSAGEKQLLSFICYNAFHRDATIFIDEPELSLHVDWQRQLFPILQRQQASNQFIFATHSPFIYGKYPDKELLIDSVRGDESSETEEK